MRVLPTTTLSVMAGAGLWKGLRRLGLRPEGAHTARLGGVATMAQLMLAVSPARCGPAGPTAHRLRVAEAAAPSRGRIFARSRASSTVSVTVEPHPASVSVTVEPRIQQA